MILCCGEALVDMLPRDGSDGTTYYAPLSGGAIFNTARALGLLEFPVQFLSGISNDLFGEQLVKDLHDARVGTTHLIRSDRPTTLAFVKLTNGHADYTFYDENSAGRMIYPDDLEGLDPSILALYFGGISLCAEPCGATYEHLAMREHANRVVMIDPNIRPGFITDEVAYRGRLDRIMACADIVKISDEDLNWIVPEGTDNTFKIKALPVSSAGLVILTKGADGAEAYKDGVKIAEVGVPRVDVVDTVGAGDTFNAGFLAELHRAGVLDKSSIGNISTDVVTQALEFAARVAAVTVTRAGANPPTLAEVQ